MASFTARGPRPSAAIRARYQAELNKLVDAMYKSVVYWLGGKYKKREDEFVAMDASPARELEKELKVLFRQWGKNFNDFAAQNAQLFAKRVNASTSNQLKGALKAAGITIAFKNSRRVNNILQSVVAENVRLIRSIPQQFLGNVTSVVMQGVQNGRDMGFIVKELQKQHKVTRNRAITIARDQTNKATQAVSEARCADTGIEYGIWMHRSGGKVPRTTHEAMNGKRFKLSEGLYDPAVGRLVKPAELINCHCTFQLDLGVINNDNQ